MHLVSKSRRFGFRLFMGMGCKHKHNVDKTLPARTLYSNQRIIFMNDNAALFELTRLQILSLEAQRHCFPVAYAHAWNKRIFPIMLEQPRDRAFEDDASWCMSAANMIQLQQVLMELPGYRRPLDIDEFAAAARDKASWALSDAHEALMKVGRARGGLGAVIEGCRYYRMQGYGNPDFWAALARSHPDLDRVALNCSGVAEFEY